MDSGVSALFSTLFPLGQDTLYHIGKGGRLGVDSFFFQLILQLGNASFKLTQPLICDFDFSVVCVLTVDSMHLNRPFNALDWSNLSTKQDKPAMSEAEFDEAIRELARKEFSSDNKDHKSIQKLIRQFSSMVSPDRKAIYEDSMKKTGGKMNAACMFYDSKGNQSFTWHPITGRWSVMPTEDERSKAREFYSIYNDELKH